MPSHPSLALRLALPLAFSLLAHAALLGVLGFARRLDHSELTGVSASGAHFSIRLAFQERARLRAKAKVEEEEAWEPILIQESPAPAVAGASPIHESPPALPSGSGAASGGGLSSSATGAGRGLLKAPATARRIVYLLDCSVSMGPSGALAAGCREIANSLRRLLPETLFQVVPYNQLAEPFPLQGRRSTLAPAAPAVVAEAVRLLSEVKAAGRTDHAGALRCALRLQPRPDVLFLITDAGDLPPGLRAPLFRLLQAGPALHVVELSRSSSDGGNLLAELTRLTHGSYRRVGLQR